ncbi:hypothetical protein ABTE30_20120, partial [Acinetobacter baumannii]
MTTLEESLSQIPAFSIIHEHLFSSAQPSIEQLKLIKEYGCSTVINLALTNSPDCIENEDRVCLEYGLNYIHIPIDWETPSSDQCLLVLDLI